MIRKLVPASALSLSTLSLAMMLACVTHMAAQDQPTIQKESVQVTAFTLSSYKKRF